MLSRPFIAKWSIERVCIEDFVAGMPPAVAEQDVADAASVGASHGI